jgi:hypothetical protein
MKRRLLGGLVTASLLVSACEPGTKGAGDSTAAAGGSDIQRRMGTYTTVALTADMSSLTAREKQMIPILIDAAKAMDPIYWSQTWGSRDSLLAQVTDPVVRQYIDINYGPYDRLDNNAAFVPEVGNRVPGANLYPQDITKEEF